MNNQVPVAPQYIKDFEKLGFGMFVHFGAYSVYGHGEWAKSCLKISDETYEGYVNAFCPKESWARELAETAASAPWQPWHSRSRYWPAAVRRRN